MTLAQRVRKEGREEGRQEGLEEGVAKGIEKGIEKGRREAALQHLFVLLEERFGRVPEGLREEVVRVDDTSRVEILYRQAIRCTSLEAFAALL